LSFIRETFNSHLIEANILWLCISAAGMRIKNIYGDEERQSIALDESLTKKSILDDDLSRSRQGSLGSASSHAEVSSTRASSKDTGWAWMCVLGVYMSHQSIFIRMCVWDCFAGSFVGQMLDIGAAKSFGVLFAEFVERFDSDIASLTWISALNGFIAMSLGAVAIC
jgi:hypothetical protein